MAKEDTLNKDLAEFTQRIVVKKATGGIYEVWDESFDPPELVMMGHCKAIQDFIAGFIFGRQTIG